MKVEDFLIRILMYNSYGILSFVSFLHNFLVAIPSKLKHCFVAFSVGVDLHVYIHVCTKILISTKSDQIQQRKGVHNILYWMVIHVYLKGIPEKNIAKVSLRVNKV